jgi:hypothetical protein
VKFSGGLALLAAEFFGAEKNALAHDFSGFEFNRRAGRNDHIVFGFVGVAADTGFGESDFENTEVAELDIAAGGEGIGDAVEGELDDTENFLLGESGLFADLHYQIPFGEVSHLSVMFSWF